MFASIALREATLFECEGEAETASAWNICFLKAGENAAGCARRCSKAAATINHGGVNGTFLNRKVLLDKEVKLMPGAN